MGRLISCGCDPSSYTGRTPAKANRGTHWKWGGCSHNLEYGMEFSRHFLDSREKAGDIQSTVNLHNNQAGRLVIYFLSRFFFPPFFIETFTVYACVESEKKREGRSSPPEVQPLASTLLRRSPRLDHPTIDSLTVLYATPLCLKVTHTYLWLNPWW